MSPGTTLAAIQSVCSCTSVKHKLPETLLTPLEPRSHAYSQYGPAAVWIGLVWYTSLQTLGSPLPLCAHLELSYPFVPLHSTGLILVFGLHHNAHILGERHAAMDDNCLWTWTKLCLLSLASITVPSCNLPFWLCTCIPETQLKSPAATAAGMPGAGQGGGVGDAGCIQLQECTPISRDSTTTYGLRSGYVRLLSLANTIAPTLPSVGLHISNLNSVTSLHWSVHTWGESVQP